MNNIYSIKCKTHLHAGSGDSNYGVIDKLVQRDPTDNIPCIFASSLKGALREYYQHKQPELVDGIFGKDDKGAVIFNQAYLISLPVKSNTTPYFNLTCPLVLNKFLEDCTFFQHTNNQVHSVISELIENKEEDKIKHFNNQLDNTTKIEEFNSNDVIKGSIADLNILETLLGNNIAITSDKEFLNLTNNYNLPVIARNNLENGVSKNLWYEQIIPRESRYYFVATTMPGKDTEAVKLFDHFQTTTNLQIGANASIGYGFCEINKL